jgi:hypothetical protein
MTVLAATVRRELIPSEAVAPLDADIGSRRSVAWTRNSLEALHRAAKSIGPTVTLNDAVIGIVAAGVRHWLVSVNRPITALRVRIPVSLHRPDEDPAAAANRDSFIDVDVPMGAPRHALRVSVISASGGISFGLCADGDILDANLIAGGIDAAIAELLQWQPAQTRPQGADP